MGTPVQQLTCRSPRDIMFLSHRQEDQDAGRSISGEIRNHMKQYDWMRYTPQEVIRDFLRSWNYQKNSPSKQLF